MKKGLWIMIIVSLSATSSFAAQMSNRAMRDKSGVIARCNLSDSGQASDPALKKVNSLRPQVVPSRSINADGSNLRQTAAPKTIK